MISAKGAGTLLAPLLACAPLPALAQQIHFNVPKQLAVTGIPEFARQAGIQIVAPVTKFQSEKTQAVRGSYSVDTALGILLRGTGLHVTLRSGNAISLALATPAEKAVVARPLQRRLPRTNPAPAVSLQLSARGEQEIIVTGTPNRLSASPQDEKQKAIGFISAVGSVELSKRTDVSVASASLRLPGVVLSRGTQTAQAWYPAIRGFDGRYSSVTLDGSVLYLSTRNQRGVPLDFLPAAAINEIVINKTVTPEMDPNSIGGHIEIKTLRVFDDDGKPLNSIDGQLVNYTKPGALSNGNPSYNVNGVVKRTFGTNGDFGFVLAGSAHRDEFDEIINSTTALVQQGNVDIPSGNLQTGNYNRHQDGASLMGKIEGRGDRWYGYVAANYFEEHIREDLARSNISIAPTLVTNASDGTGSFTGGVPSAISNVYKNDRSIVSIRSGGEYQTSEHSKLVFSTSVLHVDYKEQLLTGAPIAGPPVSGTYKITGTQVAPQITGPSSLNDPTQWKQGSDASATQPVYPLTDRIFSARLEFKANDFDFSRGFGYDVGIDFRRLHRTLNQTTYNFTLPAGASINLSQVLAPGSTFEGSNPSAPIYVDERRYWDLLSSLAVRSVDPGLTADYDLREDVIAPFLSLYYTSDKFRLLAGGRYNITRYTDATHQITNGVPTPFQITRNLPYLLPNVQAYYDLGHGTRVRAAFTETTALQDFSTFANGTALGLDYKGNPVINHTNPYLKPRRSYNEDFSLELYRPKGYFSLGYFHKTIIDESQVLTQFQYDANGVFVATIQSTINAGGEHTQGLEFEGQWRDFSGLAPWLRGVTFDINGALFDSDTEVVVSPGNGRTIDGLRLQPKWVVNMIMTYSRGRFSGSLLGMVRGRALASIATTAPGDIYIAPFGTLDAKVGYQFNRALKLYFEGKNLTNYWYREETGTHANLVSTAIKDGRTFVIGAALSF